MALKLTHALNLIEVNNKTLIVGVILLDALTAKDCFVVRAIKVLHTLRMLAAKLVLHALFVLVVEIEVTIRKLFVFLNDLVQNVDIQWQALC